MDQREGFLQAIRGEAEDDPPRLVYADWLEENGDPARAEFIRVQCELARLPEYNPRRGELEDQEADLLATHEEAWLGDPPPMLERWRWERGFVHWVCPGQGGYGSEPATLDGFEAFFARHPVRAASLTIGHDEVDSSRQARSPCLEQLRELGLKWHGGGHGEPFRDLLLSPLLAGLTSLDLKGPGDHDDCLDDLFSRPWASTLRKLGVSGVTDGGLIRLLTAPLRELTSLTFHKDGLTPHAIEALTAPDQADRWTALSIFRDEFPASALNRLGDCARLKELGVRWPPGWKDELAFPAGLTRLAVYPSPVAGPFPASALARLACLGRLRQLDIDLPPFSAPLGDDDLQGMATLLARLPGPVLHLWGVGGEGQTLALRELVRLPHLDRIRELGVWSQAVTDEDFRALVESEGLSNLHSLTLDGRRLTADDARSLAAAPLAAGLRELGLSNAGLGQEGLRSLLAGPGLKRLTSLVLQDNNLGSESLQTLLDWPGLSRLRDLNLSVNALDVRIAWPLLAVSGLSPLTRVSLTPYHGDGMCDQEREWLAARFGCRLLPL